MKIKMKKIISLVLVLLILLSNSPISLAMGKESFDEETKKAESIITTKEGRKKGFLDKKGNSESKSNSLEIKSSQDVTKESIITPFETVKELPKTYFYENNDIEIAIELKQRTLQEEGQLIVKEVDSEKDDRQLELQTKIMNKITEKLNEKQKLNKVKIYDICFINKDGDRIHDLEILNIRYIFKKPVLLEEKNELSIFSLFNNELIDSKNVEIKRNDRNEIVELSFNVDKIEQLILIDTVEKSVNLKEESQEVHEEELKEEQEDKRTDKLKEFTLNYSDYEKKLISKFEKLVKDKSGESRITHQDALELKNKFDIKDYDENSPEYIDISNIDIKDGYFLINFYKNSESKIKKIELEVAKELTLEEEIYSDKDIQEIRFILKELKDLEKSVEKLNESKQLSNKLNYLDDEVNQLYDIKQPLVLIQPLDNIKNPNSLDYEAKKEELIKALHAIKPSYNLEAQGFESLEEYSKFENKLENISLIPKNSKAYDDFTLAFKPITKDIESDHLLKITVDGDLGKQVLVFENSQFTETNRADSLIPRSYNSQPDTFQMGKVPNLQKQKTIDYLGDKKKNLDTNILDIKTPEEIADSYRIYLDVASNKEVVDKGIDLVVVVDRSRSMLLKDMIVNGKRGETRQYAIDYFLNGPKKGLSNKIGDGFIKKFLEQNTKNNISVVDFGGVPKHKFENVYSDTNLPLDWTKKVDKRVSITQPWNRMPHFEQTNYDAGLKRAEDQFNKKKNSDNRKLMLFISDGVPTLYIDQSGQRQGTGSAVEPTNVANVRNQMINTNLPDFYNRNPDITTIAVGVSKEINSNGLNDSRSPEVLKKMADLSGGVHLGIEENIDELTEQLSKKIVYAASGVKITDTLSKNVKLDSQPDFKVTMKKEDGTSITLWEKDQETVYNNHIIQSVEKKVENDEEKVILTFNPDYQLDKNTKFTLSYNVTVPKETFEDYQNRGHEYPETGDENTDYPGNETSSNKPGYRSNKEAYVEYVFMPGGKPYKEFYDHPVVQVELQNLTIKKVDSVGNSLQNAKFALYKENPDKNQNVQPLELYDNEGLKGDKKTVFITNDQGEVKIYGLVHGTYYLKEIEAPKGFNKIEKAVKVTVSRLGKVEMEKDNNFTLNDNTVIVKNELMGGYELPTTGGSGNIIFRLTGLLVLAIALIIPYRKRQIKCER